MVDGIEEKQNERCAGGGWNEMMESIKPSSQSTSEIVAFHKVKRKFKFERYGKGRFKRNFDLRI